MNASRISPRNVIRTWLGAGLAVALMMPALLATEPDYSMLVAGVNAVAYDSDGYLYVTTGGLFLAKLDPAGLDLNQIPHGPCWDDDPETESGDGVCWQRTFPNLPGEEGFAGAADIVVDDDPSDGTGIYVIGQTFRSSLHWAHPNSPEPPGWDKVAGDGVEDHRDGFLLRFDLPPHEVNATLGDAVYATFIGHVNIDRSDGIAIDGKGMAYVLNNVGPVFTTDTGMETTQYHGGRFDMYVTVIDTLVDGDASLRFAMLLGGRDRDSAGRGIAVDADGTIYVTGRTESNDFRVGTANPVYPTDGSSLSGTTDAALVVMKEASKYPDYWTYDVVHAGYIGGRRDDEGIDLSVQGASLAGADIYLAGLAGSADFFDLFQTVHGVFGGGKADAFAAKLVFTPCSPFPCESLELAWSVAIGGERDEARAILAGDAAGSFYVAGTTNSTAFPTTDDTIYQGFDDIFLAQVDSGGNQTFGTLLAGSDNDQVGPAGLAVHETDGVVQVTVGGNTMSSDFPVGPPPPNGFIAVYEFVECVPTGPEVCTGGVDEDCDGLVDCDDPGCTDDVACDLCGNGSCDSGEDSCNCPEDCGTPPASEIGLCGDGVDNDCDGDIDCDDADCADDPECLTCLGNKAPCTADEDCCSLNCGNDGRCKGSGTGGTLTESPFLRGDSNADGAVDLADPIHTLNYLFLGGPAPSCADAADSDDNGRLEMTDPVFTLGWLYLGEGTVPPPGPDSCGPDTTEDALIGCEYDPVNC